MSTYTDKTFSIQDHGLLIMVSCFIHIFKDCSSFLFNKFANILNFPSFNDSFLQTCSKIFITQSVTEYFLRWWLGAGMDLLD